MTAVFRHGALRLYLLKLLGDQPRHGYEVISLLEDRFLGMYAPSAGTVYPRLAKLEAEGLVEHEENDGRKVYSLTDAGREELARSQEALQSLEKDLTQSVSELARDVSAQVRESVRDLRVELKQAAREVRREARTQGRHGFGRESGTPSASPELIAEIDAVRAVVTRHAREASAEACALAAEMIRRCRDDVLSALNGEGSAAGQSCP
jgi:DNA-binding PadR family transcriptional regulator